MTGTHQVSGRASAVRNGDAGRVSAGGPREAGSAGHGTLTVAVIGGGQSPEHDVSLASAAAIGQALAEAGHRVIPMTIARDATWRFSGETVSPWAAIDELRRCDLVFPALHGRRGEDGSIAAFCRIAGVPFVGSGVAAGAAGMDKWLTKLVAESVGIRTARSVLLHRNDQGDVGGTVPGPRSVALPGPGLPVVVKPASAGSSYGVSLVRRPDELAPAMSRAFAFDRRVLVEEYVVGREIDIAVLGMRDGSRDTAPALEILPTEAGVFDLATKYDGTARFVVPAPLGEAQRASLRSAAIALFDALGCSGVVRVDFFLTSHGLVLNEVNTMPGFTEHSQVPRMFAAAGISYRDLVDLMARDALDRSTMTARRTCFDGAMAAMAGDST
ncbi:MAG: hypothetical protein BGO26_02425 [Actinobacteria bacterium 69-20]|nr:D-alanine--D-alanine ligase [Actinomycetota bacterium]OJV31313.1 MAG: hypothetical protein BGO26_02425 [Actinobacteria bacterium 69-20]